MQAKGGLTMDDHDSRNDTYVEFVTETKRPSSGGPDVKRKKKRHRSRFVTKKFLAVIVAITIVVSSLMGAVIGILVSSYMDSDGSYSNLENSSLDSATGSEKTIEEIVSMNEDSVVQITTTTTSDYMFGQSSDSTGAGSGVVVNKNGYIATCYHVIEGVDQITVTLHNGDDYKAEVVGYDSDNDIAVLKIDKKGLSAASIGDSSDLKVGDLSIAIGNPLGTLGGSATSGIISSLDRKLTINDRKLDLLQTDSAINPGNSGGGLFNGKGELVGIVVAKGTGVSIEGLGFALPIDTVGPIIDKIIDQDS